MIRKHSLGVSTNLEWVETDVETKPSEVKVKGNIKFEETTDKFELKTQENFDTIHKNNSNPKIVKLESGNYEITKFLTTSFNETIFEIKENCSVNLILNTKSSNFSTELIKIILKEGSSAKITYTKDTSYYLHTRTHVFLETNATVDLITADFSGTIYNDTKIFLEGRGSKSTLNHIFYGKKGDSYDVNLSSIHSNKDVYSLINAKGILDGGRIITKGLVKINSNSPDSNGYQKSDILQLSDSEAVSIPDLLIHNEQVKCSHGSTISSLDEEKVFYLQSRGLSKAIAQKNLVLGFVQEIIDKSLEPEKMQERILNNLK